MKRFQDSSLPGDVAKKIAQVQGEIGRVKLDKTHPQRGYKYASVDSVYAAVHGAMAEHGLVIVPLEVDVKYETDKKGDKWGLFTYEFVLATEKASWQHPNCRRTIPHRIHGPESCHSAQSFAEKQFLRSLFKLETGDPETEEDLTEKVAKKSQRAMKAEGAEWDQFVAAVDGADSYGELAEVEMAWRGKFPKGWAANFTEVINRRQNGIDAINGLDS
jgi:hypothetical protein